MMMLLGAFLIIGIASSTREDRAAVALALKRWNWPLGIAAALLWFIILEPWRWI